MIRREKTTSFEVIAVPSDNISSSKSQDGHADITITVPDLHDDPAHYYVVKRPDAVDDVAFKIALDAAFRAVSSLSRLTSDSQTAVYNPDISSSNKPSTQTVSNTERLEKLKKRILAESEWLPAQEVSRRGGSSVEVKNPSGLPNRWKRAKKIFAITSEGKDLYPAYALDIGGQPLPLIKKIIELFGDTRTPWSLAVWFGTPNSWLGNRKPQDLLTSAPAQVLEAALRAKEGPVHG